MLQAWLGVLLVITVLAVLLGGLAMLQKHRQLHPELLRKLLHIGMGLVTLSFPWLFNSVWPVVSLAVLSIISLLLVKRFKYASLKSVVHGVARESLGEIYFPLAIAILFSLSYQQPILFIIPVLLLTLADAVAALIGVRYGQTTYTTAEGVKSTEGSLAFFTVALLSTLIPLLLITQTGRVELLLISLILAILVMYIEALSWKGLDNLFIPLGSYLLLKVYLSMDVADLVLRLVVIVLMFIIVVKSRKRTTLNDSAILAVALAAYIIWAAAGWQWLLPAVLVFASYHRLSPKTSENIQRIHDSRAVLAVATPAMVWLFVSTTQPHTLIYFCFSAGFAAQLAMIALARLHHQYPNMARWHLWGRCVLQSSVIVLIPWWLVVGITSTNLLWLLLGVALNGLAVLAFYYLQPDIHDCPTDTQRFVRQSLIGFIVSLLPLLLLV